MTKRSGSRATGPDVLEALRMALKGLALARKYLEQVRFTSRQAEAARQVIAGIDELLEGVLHAVRESGNAKAEEG